MGGIRPTWASCSISTPSHMLRILIRIPLYFVSTNVKKTILMSTLQPLYNTVRYKTVLDITRFKDGSQKCIDYIEK